MPPPMLPPDFHQIRAALLHRIAELNRIEPARLIEHARRHLLRCPPYQVEVVLDPRNIHLTITDTRDTRPPVERHNDTILRTLGMPFPDNVIRFRKGWLEHGHHLPESFRLAALLAALFAVLLPQDPETP